MMLHFDNITVSIQEGDVKMNGISHYIPRKDTVGKWLGLLIILTLLMTCIPQQQPASAACSYRYKVQSGDSLYIIANLYSVTLTELADANDLKEPYMIYVGQVLCIPPGASKPEPTETSDTTTTTTTSSATTSKEAFTSLSIGGIVWIGMANFEKEHFYYAKVYGAGTGYWNHPYYKLGIFQTDKEGKYGAWYHLPTQVRDVYRITVCVKNAINDDLEWCETITNNTRHQWEY